MPETLWTSKMSVNLIGNLFDLGQDFERRNCCLRLNIFSLCPFHYNTVHYLANILIVLEAGNKQW